MSDSTSGILQKAYELIENDELEQASALLTPLLETDAENPSLWWVYSHALRDPAIGQLALDRVIALDPDYPGATELKADAQEAQEREADLLGLDAENETAAQSAVDVTIDDWEDLQPAMSDADESSSGRRGFALLIVALLIVATGAALVASGAVDIEELLAGILPTAEPAITTPPTAEPAIVVVGSSTEIPTAEASPTAMDLDELAAIFVRDVAESIEEFELNREASGIETKADGKTLILHVCATSVEFQARLKRIGEVVVALVEKIPAGIDAVATGLRNCSDENAALLTIGAPVSTIMEYAAGEIDDKEFQRAWQQPLP